MCLLEICPIGDAVWWIARGRYLAPEAAEAELKAWEAYHSKPCTKLPSREPGEMTSEAHEDAKAALRDALFAGRLKASGRTAEHRPIEPIPAEWWATLMINSLPNRLREAEVLNSAFDEPCYWREGRRVRGVTVRGGEIMTIWPAIAPPGAGKRTPRGRKPHPIWRDIEPKVLAWLEEEGEQRLAEVERFIHDRLADRGLEFSPSVVRDHANRYLNAFRKQLARL